MGVLALLVAFPARAEDFLQTAQTLWFDGKAVPPATISMNLKGISAAAGLEVLRASLGGVVRGDTLTGTSLGTIQLRPRLVNGERDGVEWTLSSPSAEGIASLDRAWNLLAGQGARGERPDQPPRVRVQISNVSPAVEKQLASNLSYPDHLQQMRDFGGVPNGGGMTASPSPGTIELNLQDGLSAPVRQAIGIFQITTKEGAIDHDRWVQSATGMDREQLPQLREQFRQKRNEDRAQPIVVRYLLGDPENKRNADSPWHGEIKYHQPPIGAMRADQQGETPLILRPGAIVWHPRVHHQQNVLGDMNPALINGDLAELLTSNKWFEALWFNKHLPGAMSRTEHLGTIFREGEIDPKNVEAVLSELNRRFPTGWVLKAVKESHSSKLIVTDKLDVKKLIADYRASDFDTFRQRALVELAGQDEDNLTARLQEHPAYLGWRLAHFLSEPNNVIAQARVEIDKEFRVEGIAGRVLGKFSTVDRYGHKVWKTEQQQPTFTDPKIIEQVEKYTQALLDRLPPELRGTPFAFDIALLKDGSFTVIESNAGPESGYFSDFRYSVGALSDFLRHFDKLKKEGKVADRGMSPARMNAYLNGLLTEWKLDPEAMWPHLEVHRTFDPAHPHTVEARYDRTTQPPAFYRRPEEPPTPAICPFARVANTP